jgi:hypothetical protein
MAKSKYQTLREAGLCTRGCGRKGELRNHQKNSPRKSECRICKTTSHGQK